MNGKSEDAIGEIGMLYMSEMNKQLQEKFSSITALRMTINFRYDAGV